MIEDQPACSEYRPDTNLIAAVVKANVWWGELCAGRVGTIKEIAVRENSDERYIARILKLAFLAPDITATILDGRQPPDLTADTLITSHKELDFSREGSVHADVVGGLEGHGANGRERLASMAGLWVVGARA